MDTIRGHIKRIPELLAPKIDTIKTNFDQWKVPWTQDRAEKIDHLDVPVSTRSTQASVDGLMSNVGETSDSGGGVNEGTAMAKLNRLLTKMPLYEEYDIQKTNYSLIMTDPLEFLDVSGEAVLIGYSINNPTNWAGSEDAVTVKIYTDGVLMYDMGLSAHSGSSDGRTSNVFSSFDDNFLINLRGVNVNNFYDSAHINLPSANHFEVVGRSSEIAPILAVPPIAQSSLIVEAFKKPEVTRDVTISIMYGVKK